MKKPQGNFILNESFSLGYRNREDVTTLKPGIMVTGSQNVLTNTFQRIGARKGYTLDGQRSISKISATGYFQVNDYTKATTTDAGKTLTIAGISLTFGTTIPTGGLVSNADLASRIVTAINASAINVPNSPTGVHAEIGNPPDHTTSQAVLIANVQGETGNLIAYSTTATATLSQLGPFLGGGLNHASADPIRSAYDWARHTGDERHLRAGYNSNGGGVDGKLQYRYVASGGEKYLDQTFIKDQVYWIDLLTGLTSTTFNFADYWWSSSFQSILLMVNGTSQIYMWGGGVGVLESVDNSAGHIKTISMPPAQADGGSGYGVGDVLNISGGTDGQATVTSVGLQTGIIFVLNPNPNAFGSGYAVNDTFTITTGDGNAIGKVTAIGGGGTATQVSLLTAGSGYTASSFNATTAITGTGSGLQVQVTQITQLANSVKTVALKAPGVGYSTGTFATTGGQGTGAKVKIDAIITGSLTLSGTTTLPERGFLYDNTLSQQVRINGNLYTYQSVFNRTLFGITPSAASEPINSIVHQEPNVNVNSAMPGLPTTFGQDLIATLNQQIYLGNTKNNTFYISRVNLMSFTHSATPLPGEGSTHTLDAPPVAFIPERDSMFISAGKHYWYRVVFTLADNLLSESVTVARVKSTTGQGSQSQGLTTKIKNAIAYVSFEPIVNVFGTAQNYLDDPQTQDISYPIVEDVNGYDFTGGFIRYFRKQIYLSIPTAGILRVYNMTNDFSDQADISPSQMHYWESPQTIPVGPLSFIDGKIIGHSSQDSNSYVLFDGGSDDGHPIEAKAVMSYENGGVRDLLKTDQAVFVETYMTPNTDLTVGLKLGIGQTPQEFVIEGDDPKLVPRLTDDSSLGKNPLGKVPLGSSVIPTDQFIGTNTNLPKIRVAKTFPPTHWFERQISFTSLGVDQVWEIVSFGTNYKLSSELPTNISE